MGLAREGSYLAVADAIVLAEADALFWYGDKRARWGDPTYHVDFAEPIGLPEVRFDGRVPDPYKRPFAAAVCKAQFLIGGTGEEELFTVSAEDEGPLAEDALILEMLRRFTTAYCASPAALDRPAVVIPMRRKPVATAAGAGPSPRGAVIDNRRWSREISATAA